jgi:hypothetical protein
MASMASWPHHSPSGNQKRFWRDPVKQCHSRPNSSASEISRDDFYDDGRGNGVGRGLGVGVALGVLKRNAQVNSATGWPVAQLKAPAGICMVLRPCTTGEVLKTKVMVRSSGLIVSESAGVPLTVKSLAWTVAGSIASLRLIMKTVGWVNITPGQEVVTEQVCASANGTA